MRQLSGVATIGGGLWQRLANAGIPQQTGRRNLNFTQGIPPAQETRPNDLPAPRRS
jgi:hypothetical protein